MRCRLRNRRALHFIFKLQFSLEGGHLRRIGVAPDVFPQLSFERFISDLKRFVECGLDRFARIKQVNELSHLLESLSFVTQNQVMDQGPRLSVKDIGFVLLVVIGRTVIHGEERSERQQFLLSQKKNVV